jgi:hypothetical protein
MRSEAEGQVTLAYQIVPGPKTSIMVSGLDVDAGASFPRLGQGVVDAVYDEFLIDEAVGVIKERLSAEGYLQAMVTARVEGDATAKVLTVAVDRGARMSNTTIEVRRAGPAEGGPAVEIPSIADVEGVCAIARPPVARAAIDPGSLEARRDAYLRSEGHLRAKVTAGAPRFEDTTAVCC